MVLDPQLVVSQQTILEIKAILIYRTLRRPELKCDKHMLHDIQYSRGHNFSSVLLIDEQFWR